MSAITTHILDVSTGFPARGVPVRLEKQTSTGWEIVGKGATDDDGRLRDLLAPDAEFSKGDYRLTFDVETYFRARAIEGFYAQVTIAFVVRDSSEHYHVPLLLSPFGYSTYRGS
ncbi:MAG TPA: hydroxyisourate hydrolase [Pyrinomonadaceae bacterium]|jgi:5-hydroxyisourate hydrolase